jgi:hypothetical protein
MLTASLPGVEEKLKRDGELSKINCVTAKRETGVRERERKTAQKEEERDHYIRTCHIRSFITP